MIVKLPAILPGDLDLADINQQLRLHKIELDWSSVISAPESQLTVLLAGVDQVEDADWLISGDIAENIATDLINFFKKQKSKYKKPTSPKKSLVQDEHPTVWRLNKLLETKFIPASSDGKLFAEEFIPGENVVTAETPKILESQIPNASKIRDELEQAVLADLLGPAGGEEEEVDEDNVSDRYLVGLLAPQIRHKGAQTLEKETLREVDCQQPELMDELAVVGKGTAEEGTTEVSIPPAESMFPSSFGMTFCVSSAAKALQITSGWGQYKRGKSTNITKKDDTPKIVWKRQQIREKSPSIPLIAGEIAQWIVHPDYPQVYVQGKIRQQSNGGWIVSLFLINGQKEPAKLRDEAWLFQPELSVTSADTQHPDIFLKRHQPRNLGKLDPVIYAEEKAMAMLYRKQVEFAIGHGVSIHAETAQNTTERAIKLSTSIVPVYEVPKTSPPQADEIPELAGLVLDMQELGTTATADFPTKLNPLITAYTTWIWQQTQRISHPKN